MILEVIKNDALRQIEKERSVAASLRAYLPVSFFDLLSVCTSLCQYVCFSIFYTSNNNNAYYYYI